MRSKHARAVAACIVGAALATPSVARGQTAGGAASGGGTPSGSGTGTTSGDTAASGSGSTGSADVSSMPMTSDAATAATVRTPTPPVRGGTPPPRWGHQNQVTIRAGFSGGYRIGVRYGDGVWCSSDPGPMGQGTTFCPRPIANFDFGVGFGVAPILEIEARFRVGLPDYTTTVPLAAGLGIRLYTNDDSPLKMSAGVMALLDFTAPGTVQPRASAWSPVDVLIRFEPGLHYDINRYFGFTVLVGISAQPVRALFFGFDGGVSLQARFP